MALTEVDLERFIIDESMFAEIEQASNVFCPFEAVGMVKQEIRHGYFLKYFFDPHRPHGFGAECLKAFMAALARSQAASEYAISRLDAHLMDLDGVEIKREDGRIDLTIILPNLSRKLVVAIELKIESSESKGQLRRYREFAETQWPKHKGWSHQFVFLTMRGDDPSEDNGEGWIALDFQTLANQLDIVITRNIGKPDARNLLVAYLAMLRRNYLVNDRLEQLAAELWSKHRAALDFLADRRPDNLESAVFQQLYEKRDTLAERMSKACGITIISDHSSPSYVRFAVSDWDNVPNFKSAQNWTPTNRILLLELAKGGGPSVRLRFVLGRGDQIIRKSMHDVLRQSGVDMGNRGTLTAEWNRLASETLYKFKNSAETDQDSVVSTVMEKAEQFAIKHLASYNSAILKMLSTS
jgi:hypothetical protein